MRIGYSYWGFLGDHKLDEEFKPISAPDGNATYSWSVIYELQEQGHDVWAMQVDRDYPAVCRHGGENFRAFAYEKRNLAYTSLRHTNGLTLPDLDLLLIEWRFPIPGRNCAVSKADPSYQPDLDRQTQILKHYKDQGTKIIIWDLDHKLTEEDERKWQPDAIFETSASPLKLTKERVRVEPPLKMDALLEWPTLPCDPKRKLVYIGSRYERDDIIQKYITPVSDRFPGEVEFWGNWLKTIDEVRKMWPNIKYNDRVTTKDFRSVYGTAVACPLLAKQSYLNTGFITPRPWEALMFGTIPIGLTEAKGIEDYVLFSAKDAHQLGELVEVLSNMSVSQRAAWRYENASKLEFMDASRFVQKMFQVL